MIIKGENLTRCDNYHYCDKRNVCARTNNGGTRFYSYYRISKDCSAFIGTTGEKRK